MNKNILITSVGKRVSLVKIFKEQLSNFDSSAKVYTTEMNPSLSPAAKVSDGCFKVESVLSSNYINNLLEICINNKVRIVIPTIDTELKILASNKEMFSQEGVDILVSDIDFIGICRDKRKTNVFMEQYNLKVPKPINLKSPTFPIFAKPYDGSLSSDLHIINNELEITEEILNNPKLMFMELIDKREYKEFTVDMYYGKDNKVKSIVPRERIEIRAGEINKGYTRKNEIIFLLKNTLDYIPGVVGCVCMQFFYKEKNNDLIAIEINPRFGGGYPLSYYAGANFPQYIIQEYLKNEIIYYSEDWLDNTLMLRYDDEIIVYDK